MLGPTATRFESHGHDLSAQRARVFEYVRAADQPTTVREIARELDQHPNTVREHLDGLVDIGLLRRETGRAHGRGRPSLQYWPANAPAAVDPRVRDYAGLAVALATQISRSSADPQADALAAGDAWGRSLVADATQGGATTARRQVVELLGERGFAPASDARHRTVRLRECPMLDAARTAPDIVCAVHLGLVRSLYEGQDMASDGVDLVPFARPGACLLTLPANGAPE